MSYQIHADIAFLALTIWREARGEIFTAQKGVGFVIMNRVAKPSWWGNSIMSVIFKKWQFSSLTDPKDKQLATWPKEHEDSWLRCLEIAYGVVNGLCVNPVPGADSYYDISIPAPKWATDETFVAQIGKLRFYNLDRDVERK